MSPSDMPPMMAALVNELGDTTSDDVAPMIKTTVLGNLALSVQGLYDQVRPNCAPGPCALLTIPLAETSAFKSTIRKELEKPILTFERKQAAELAKSDNASKSEHRIWAIRLDVCEKQLKKEWNRPLRRKRRSLQHELIMAREPGKKKPLQLLYAHATWQGLFFGMAEHGPVAGLYFDEASRFTSGPLTSALDLINSGWDGSDFRSNLKTTGNTRITGICLTLVAALQSRPFRRFVEGKGQDADELGFLARCLVSHSPKPDRRGIAGKQGVSTAAREHYWSWSERLLTRLGEKLSAGDVSRKPVPMSADAKRQWIAAFEWLAQSVRAGGCYEPIENYIAKCAENIARIALIYEVTENEHPLDVSLENMRRAIRMCKWFTEQYIQIFGSMYIPVVQQDAVQMKAWLRDYHQNTGQMHVSTRIVRQYCWGGREFRHDKKRVDAALDYLEVEGVIAQGGYGSRKFIWLSTNHFGIGASAVSTLGGTSLPPR
ncbi:DUF3987 domain-containing protein [Paraburkholderia sp. MM5477-R1]|uniref:DUF3987 domain-containing protein n=1 Tax=Paraburkholderia sp. MM5477-R1 TaxID=2991062 RepID=UPI003D23B644